MEIKVLYILSGNLSTTPRALQSIKTAKTFYEIDVLAVNRSTLWEPFDMKLANELNIKIKYVSIGRKPIILWLLSSFINKFAKIIYPFHSKNLMINAFASSKSSFLLNRKLKKYIKNYDLIIAHSYGSLFPAFHFASKKNIPFIFDVEDYHPEECINEDANNEKQRRIFLLQQLIPKAAFYTSASPLIGEYTEKLVGHKEKHTVILNAFPKEEFNYTIVLPENEDELNFVWFSQNISLGRGLEQFFDGLIYWLTKNPLAKISVTLIGNMYPQFQEYINVKIKTHELKTHILIHHIPPVAQKELHQKLAEFDIGIASEQVNSDFNREICLTNKILAYAQAGLFILATDTKAQVAFLKSYDGLGVYNSPNENGFAASLDFIWSNRELIRNQKKNRFNLTEELSWDNESKKLVELWSQAMC